MNDFITDCFKNYLYNINVTDKYIHIVNYSEITSINDNCIKINFICKSLSILGMNLLVKKMDKYELLITGEIEKVLLNEK